MTTKVLLTKLSKDELETQFSQKLIYTIDMYLISVAKVMPNDYLIIESYLNLSKNEHLDFRILSNILEYLIEFEIILTEFDIFKIIHELHLYILEMIKMESNAELNKKDITKNIWKSTLSLYGNILYEKSSRKLHPNNLKKINAIIESGKQDEFYGKMDLYYIFRNVMDAVIEE